MKHALNRFLESLIYAFVQTIAPGPGWFIAIMTWGISSQLIPQGNWHTPLVTSAIITTCWIIFGGDYLFNDKIVKMTSSRDNARSH